VRWHPENKREILHFLIFSYSPLLLPTWIPEGFFKTQTSDPHGRPTHGIPRNAVSKTGRQGPMFGFWAPKGPTFEVRRGGWGRNKSRAGLGIVIVRDMVNMWISDTVRRVTYDSRHWIILK
jgi:hypothetical protein